MAEAPSSLLITIHAATAALEKQWAESIRPVLRELPHISVRERSHSAEDGQMVLIDSRHPKLDQVVRGVPRDGRSLVLLHSEGEPLPAAFAEGRVDDLLLFPLRSLELLSKLRQHEQMRLWEQVSRMNEALGGVIERLRDDMSVAERLQKARLPVRFPEIKGFKVTSRYLAGMKSGGDYFDLAESSDGRQLALILTDSSSYGLSSAVVSGIVRVASRLSVEQSRSVRELVRAFYEELLVPLGPSDRLSMFYGVLSRKDYVLRYLNLGSSRAFHRTGGGKFAVLSSQGGPLSQGSRHSLAGGAVLQEASVSLAPSDRLVLVSDGYLELLGGEDQARELLDRFAEKPAEDLLNELAFQMKSRLENPREELPSQDSSALVFDVDAKVMRLI
jgi:serine phosphatase RsbU (regulator of sigma subunit)